MLSNFRSSVINYTTYTASQTLGHTWAFLLFIIFYYFRIMSTYWATFDGEKNPSEFSKRENNELHVTGETVRDSFTASCCLKLETQAGD